MSESGRNTLRLSRRDLLRAGAAAAGAAAVGQSPLFGVPAVRKPQRPNFLLVICDQMNLDAMSALGNAHLRTPNLDRLARCGTLFLESHSTNPVCSPARSSMLTGRMPVETGVTENDQAIRPGIPHIGEWLREQAGYEAVYCGKWHLPQGYAPVNLRGFRVLPAGGGQGAADDCWISRSCGAFLRNRAARGTKDSFLMVASYLQPHDICYWMIHPDTLVRGDLPFPRLAAQLPPLPPNHQSRPEGPERARRPYERFKTEGEWRYYLYCYYRMVEMLDHDVGRLLETLEETGYARDTVVVFTSDHGDGAARHGNVQKWHPYDESVKVPLIWCCPDRIRAGARDAEHLVSGLDIVNTFCDYAGVPAPPKAQGLSLRPLLEGRATPWREYLVAEWQIRGRIVRTPQYKYVVYEGDPVVQLFDMRADPWETRSLAGEAQYATVIRDHARLLQEWNARMEVAPQT